MPAATESLPAVHGPARRRNRERDARLDRSVRRSLEDTGYRPLRCIDCRVSRGVVVLSGRVPSWYMKQVAQTVVQKIDAVDVVENRLQVRPVPRRP